MFFRIQSPVSTSLLLAAFLVSGSASADEFYGLQLPGKCHVEIGAITRVDDKKISLLTVEGKHLELNSDDVSAIFIFNSVANPVRKIERSEPLLSEIKAIYATSSSKPTFLGWPVRFLENLVVFLDLEGKSHVLDLETIYQIRAAEPADLPEFPLHPGGADYSFDLKGFLPDCNAIGGKTGERLAPTRTLAEQIRVRQLLDDLDHGYDKLENLQERTRFYAKPFLYDRRARLGFLAISNRQESNLNIPAYFTLSTGRPFRFQGFSVVGAQTHDHFPNLEPALLFRSDVKAHFFHAHLSGNLQSFSAGRKYFLGSGSFSGDIIHGALAGEAQTSFNYMALMGFDYGPFSISGGRYYPIFAMRNLHDTRELTAQDSSLIFDFSYTKDKYRILFVYAPDVNRDLNTPTSGDFSGATGITTTIPKQDPVASLSPPSELHLHAGFWRLNGEYQILEPMRLSASVFSSYLQYRELSSAGVDVFNASRKGLSLSVRQDFGDYVALSLVWNHSWNSLDLNYYGTPSVVSYSYSQMGGSLEFLF